MSLGAACDGLGASRPWRLTHSHNGVFDRLSSSQLASACVESEGYKAEHLQKMLPILLREARKLPETTKSMAEPCKLKHEHLPLTSSGARLLGQRASRSLTSLPECSLKQAALC